MEQLSFACLMPTFGRPFLVMNQIATFRSQRYPSDRKLLVIYDDAGQLKPLEDRDLVIISSDKREPTLLHKYNAMLGYLTAQKIQFDAVALMDDDDIYGPDWLASHNLALTRTMPTGCVPFWSYPFSVFSLYGVKSGERPVMERSAGRFWASAAVRRGVIEGGFGESRSATFDQDALATWFIKHGAGGIPDAYYLPQYCYGWGRAGNQHDSLKQQPKDGWRPIVERLEHDEGVVAIPRMDETTRRLWEILWNAKV